MDKDELFKLLNNITPGNEPKQATFKKHDRVLIIDGLNLFLRKINWDRNYDMGNCKKLFTKMGVSLPISSITCYIIQNWA